MVSSSFVHWSGEGNRGKGGLCRLFTCSLSSGGTYQDEEEEVVWLDDHGRG